jgi:hypothetical protein
LRADFSAVAASPLPAVTVVPAASANSAKILSADCLSLLMLEWAILSPALVPGFAV